MATSLKVLDFDGSQNIVVGGGTRDIGFLNIIGPAPSSNYPIFLFINAGSLDFKWAKKIETASY
jgi:hypothetical protein